MRELKFRGRLKQTIGGQKKGEWFYWKLTDSFSDISSYIDIETIGQFTGCLDKNKKEIYTDDIIKYKITHVSGATREGVGRIRYDTFFSQYVVTNNQNNDYPLYQISFKTELEIIGNVHENPELLK